MKFNEEFRCEFDACRELMDASSDTKGQFPNSHLSVYVIHRIYLHVVMQEFLAKQVSPMYKK